MHKFLTAALAATFLATGALATAVADPGHGNGDHGKDHAKAIQARAAVRYDRAKDTNRTWKSTNRTWKSTSNNWKSKQHEKRENRENRESRSRGYSSTHNCVNPAGNKRGWCKGSGTYRGRYGNRATSISGTVVAVNGNMVTFRRDNGSTITVVDNNGTTLNVGSHYTLTGQMVNGQFVLGSNNGTYGQSNQTVTGTIMSVGNGTVTLLGLPPKTINVQQAINNGATNGSLSIGRSITAYGYYSNNVFYATAIQ